MPRTRKKRHRCSHQIHQGCPFLAGAGLPKFSKPLGLDFIITPSGTGVLIELQHGFGRRGLLRLFPAANKSYRRRFRSLLRELGTCFEIQSGLREICNDKINTYSYFADFQPASFVYRAWSAKLEQWLDELEAEVILTKPPTESCGRGIRVYGRRTFRESAGTIRLANPTLIQALTECRPLLDDDGLPHVGCIRHIVLLVSDGERLSFTHLPSYWRVSPVPTSGLTEPDRNALTANISRGAYPLAVSADDEHEVRRLSEQICARLVATIVGLADVSLGERVIIEADGTLPELPASGTVSFDLRANL